jgi:hypothetical protein
LRCGHKKIPFWERTLLAFGFVVVSSKSHMKTNIHSINHLCMVVLLLLQTSQAAIVCPAGIGSGVCPFPAGSNAFLCDTDSGAGKDSCIGRIFSQVEGDQSLCKTLVNEGGVCEGTTVTFAPSLNVAHGMTCEAENACKDATIDAGNLGTVICKPGGTGTNVASTDQEACLGTDPTVKNLKITASCLKCEATHSCGKNILFKDAGVTGSTFVAVTPYFVGNLGSGCPPKKKLWCFSGHNSVDVQGKGMLSMASLEVGDFVKIGQDTFSQVVSFMHKDPDAEVEYLQFYSKASNMPLEVSSEHFVFRGKDKFLVRAGDIQVGDELGQIGNKVHTIRSIKRRGLYAPLTESGELLVSGIPSSSYIALLDNMVAPSVQAAASHAALAPLRLACRFDFSICQNETYSKDGFSSNLEKLVQFGLGLTNFGAVGQLLVLTTALPVLIGIVAFEKLSLLGLLAGLTVGVIVFRTNRVKHL